MRFKPGDIIDIRHINDNGKLCENAQHGSYIKIKKNSDNKSYYFYYILDEKGNKISNCWNCFNDRNLPDYAVIPPWASEEPQTCPGILDGELSNNKKSFMGNIITFAKNMTLSANEKLLREIGLKDNCGEYTSNARDIIIVKLCADNEAYLLTVATAMKAEQSEKKS